MRWTPEEDLLLIEQARLGLPMRKWKVAGRSSESCKSRYEYMLERRMTTRDVRAYRRERVSHAALIERDRIASIEPTLSQYYFGDPMPGRSALDKRA